MEILYNAISEIILQWLNVVWLNQQLLHFLSSDEMYLFSINADLELIFYLTERSFGSISIE